MTTEVPHSPQPSKPTLEPQSAPAEARDRVETERLIGRRRRTWRVILALLVSAALLLLAIGVRRDQVRRELAVGDLQELADRLEQRVHEHLAFPANLQAVAGESIPNVDQRYGYAPRERRLLAIRGNTPVVLVFDRKPLKQMLGRTGRAVLLCRRVNFQVKFQVKWLTESELARQRRTEEREMQKAREASHIQVSP